MLVGTKREIVGFLPAVLCAGGLSFIFLGLVFRINLFVIHGHSLGCRVSSGAEREIASRICEAEF